MEATRQYVSDDAAPHARGAAEAPSVALIRTVRSSIVGDDDAIPTPLGARRITYADHTASGRSVAFIERYIAENVMPWYSNTHTTTSETGLQSHFFLSEARDLIRDSTNASAGGANGEDVVLFVGRGATAASNALVHFMGTGADGRGRPGATDADDEEMVSCTFPGCAREFRNAVDLHLHARTHPDGEQTAWQRTGFGPAGAAATASTTPTASGAATVAPAVATTAAGSAPMTVIVGPYAHHSSFLPWRQAGAQLVFVPEDAAAGGADFSALWRILEHATGHAPLAAAAATTAAPSVVGVFTAASNVTGALVDVDAITAACHAFGVPAVWDFAAAAPHTSVDMNPKRTYSLGQLQAMAAAAAGTGAAGAGGAVATRAAPSPLSAVAAGAAAVYSCAKDAAFFSMHKWTGGPGAPGVLIVKRRHIRASASGGPHLPGGGTVFFVQPDGTPRFLANDAEREEGGSPDLLAAVRAGLCMHLMRSVGLSTIAEREGAMAAAARARWARHPRIRVVGNQRGAKVPIVALAVEAPAPLAGAASGPKLMLHWGFVCALLNDVFGIQARGGCLCAGPYSMALLGIDAPLASALEAELLHKHEILRPGVVRVSFPYHMSHESFQYMCAAVEWVASFGHSLLHMYTPVRETGEWRINRSHAHAYLMDGYRAQRTWLGAGSPSAAPADSAAAAATLVAAAAAAAPLTADHVLRVLPVTVAGTGLSPAAVVAAATVGDGAGHLQQAMRGAIKAHPRRWLQDMRFTGDGGVTWPEHRVRIALAPDVMPPAAAGAAASGAGAAAIDTRPAAAPTGGAAGRPGAVTEAQLLEAYMNEAMLLVAGAHVRAAPAATHHAPSGLLITPAARTLRWFALGSDYDVAAAAAASSSASPLAAGDAGAPAPADALPERLDLLTSLQCWSASATAVAAVAVEAPSAGLASAFSTVGHAGWALGDPASAGAPASGAAAAAALLQAASDDAAARASWNGLTESPLTAAALAAASEVHGASTFPAASIGVVRAGGDAPEPAKGKTKQQKARPAAPPAATVASRAVGAPAVDTVAADALVTASAGAGSAEVADAATGSADASASAASAAGAAADAAARQSARATMTESAYRARAAHYAPIKAALARILPQPLPEPMWGSLRRGVLRGLQEFAMVQEGDRLLVGLSGGKDSLTLLIALLLMQEHSPVRYEVGACTVDPMYPGFDPSPLKDFLASLGVPYFYASEPVIDLAATYMDRDSICAWCSRMKRGILYSTARREGYNVLVLGQHLDDFAESFVMSAFRNGLLRTMKANYTNDAGDIRIIRPLVFVRERQTREFATAMKLPIITENCPACYTGPTERYHVKKILATEEATNRALFSSLATAMRPLMADEGARAVRKMQIVADDVAASARASRGATQTKEQREAALAGVGAGLRKLLDSGLDDILGLADGAAAGGDAEDDDCEESGLCAPSFSGSTRGKAGAASASGGKGGLFGPAVRVTVAPAAVAAAASGGAAAAATVAAGAAAASTAVAAAASTDAGAATAAVAGSS